MEQSSKLEIFENMTKVSEILTRETSILGELVDFISDSDVVSKRIGALETEADDINHYITRIYRETELSKDDEAMRLFKVFSKLEECTDVIDELATAIVSYNVTEIRSEMVQDLVLIDSCANKGINELIHSLKDDDYFTSQKLIILINHFKSTAISNEANNMRMLFTTEENPIEIIRWKEIIITFQKVFTAFEAFADECEEYLLMKQ